jgi:hypothetical protein
MDGETKNLGGLERPADERDLILGGAVAPAQIPTSFLPDYSSWFKRNFQGQTEFCGQHAGTHFKAILDFNASNGATQERKSPRFGVIEMKTPGSPVSDGYPITAGTDMRAIFKWLQQVGAADFEPLENNITLPVTEYCNPSLITPEIKANAAQSVIANYAFGNTDFESLCQLIYAKKVVLLLIKCDDGLWGTGTPTFTHPMYGHFVVADGYDENHIRIIDSADPNDALAVKMIAKQYITPTFIYESGTAIDPALAQAIKSAIVTDAAAVVQAIATDTQTPIPQKESVLEVIEEVVEAIL